MLGVAQRLLDTEVVWRLLPEGNDALHGMTGDWRGVILASLRDHLAMTAPDHEP